jgi:UDP-N-acetylglucosamine--N-acetylmuramyl-(pentapeptide) pyrophosphoryl-undecaprenol N-acetylglucosamine transferase
VRAGKFRRYHGQGWKQLLDVKTNLKNTRDVFYVFAGLYQSWRLLKRLRPEVIFIKGGFVGVPVGLAAAWLKIPFITHDSDIIPGLANRIIARWAKLHTVAMPKERYNYPPDKTMTVGVPLVPHFVPVTANLKRKYRSEIDIPANAKLLFVIGGGLGSQGVNKAVAETVPHLLSEFPDLYVVHGVGRANEHDMEHLYDKALSATQRSRVSVYGYLMDVFRYSGAADIVITRAGATNLAEFALQGKACLVVPAAFLTGGQQLKNARYLNDEGAIALLPQDELEADPNRLAKQVSELLKNTKLQHSLEKRFHTFAHSDAARKLAVLLLEEVK